MAAGFATRSSPEAPVAITPTGRDSSTAVRSARSPSIWPRSARRRRTSPSRSPSGARCWCSLTPIGRPSWSWQGMLRWTIRRVSPCEVTMRQQKVRATCPPPKSDSRRRSRSSGWQHRTRRDGSARLAEAGYPVRSSHEGEMYLTLPSGPSQASRSGEVSRILVSSLIRRRSPAICSIRAAHLPGSPAHPAVWTRRGPPSSGGGGEDSSGERRTTSYAERQASPSQSRSTWRPRSRSNPSRGSSRSSGRRARMRNMQEAP